MKKRQKWIDLLNKPFASAAAKRLELVRIDCRSWQDSLVAAALIWGCTINGRQLASQPLRNWISRTVCERNNIQHFFDFGERNQLRCLPQEEPYLQLFFSVIEIKVNQKIKINRQLTINRRCRIRFPGPEMAERAAWSAEDPRMSEIKPSHSPMRSASSSSMEVETETSFLRSTFPIQNAPTLHSGAEQPRIET